MNCGPIKTWTKDLKYFAEGEWAYEILESIYSTILYYEIVTPPDAKIS